MGTLIGVRLQARELEAIDDWRRGQPDLPTRPEAIRRLVTQARTLADAQGLEDLYRAFLLANPVRAKSHGCDAETDVDSLLWYQFHSKKGEADSLGTIQKFARKWLDRLDRDSDAEAIRLKARLGLIAK
jgi:hypothetical protein